MSREPPSFISGRLQCSTSITSNEEKCAHRNKIDDEATADEICYDCGLVLGRILTSSWSENEVFHKREESDVFNFIQDVCHNGHFSSDIADRAYSTYKKTKKKIKTRKIKVTNRAMAAFAIYKVMEKLDIPRTFDEIEAITGVPQNKIWKVASLSLELSTKEETSTEKPSHPTNYVERYCSALNIDYYECKIIKIIVGNMFGFGSYKPSSLVAAVIRLYSLEKKKPLSLKQIAEVCGISSANVHRIIRQLDPKYRNKISLLYC